MIFKMSRFVTDQRAVFNSNELFRRLCRESDVRYVGCRELTIEERREKFRTSCKNGRAEIAFIATGMNLSLQFFPWDLNLSTSHGNTPSIEYVNFDHEKGKVFLKAPFILNGVCVCWKGWINLNHLDGMGYVEFDEERAIIEASELPSTSGLQMLPASDIPNPKIQATKHHASPDHQSHIDKRPRLR